jgi:nucleoid-associated protein EbfC
VSTVGEVPGPGHGEADDVAALMARARRRQEEIQRIQRRVEAMEVTGSSRHDEVRVTVRGDRHVTGVSIDPDAISQYGADEIGDIVKEALNDGLRLVAEASAAQFRPVIEAAERSGAARRRYMSENFTASPDSKYSRSRPQ